MIGKLPASPLCLVVSLIVSSCAQQCYASESNAIQAELASVEAICSAQANKTLAESQLAQWKLAQLQELRERGHATWQELAEQRQHAASLDAIYRASNDHKTFVAKLRVTLLDRGASADQRSETEESILLMAPGSMRLIGWLPVSSATRKTLQRQAQLLRADIAAATNLDRKNLDRTSLDEKLLAATKRVQRFQNQLPSASSPQRVAARLSRAQIQVNLAKANKELAVAKHAMREILTDRMAMIEKELANRGDQEEGSVAVVGTPFVTSANSAKLDTLTEQVAQRDAADQSELRVLEQLAAIQAERVDSLQRLTKHATFQTNELKKEQSALAVLESAIQEQLDVSCERRKLAASLGNASDLAKSDAQRAFPALSEVANLKNAAAIRHIVQLHQECVSLEAAKVASSAKYDFVKERLARVAKMQADRESNQAKRERALAELRVELAAAEVNAIESKQTTLNLEAQRFLAQREAQQSTTYELVQAHDRFVSRADIELQEVILSAIGFVGEQAPQANGYLESSAVAELLGEDSSGIRSETETIAYPNARLAGPSISPQLRVGRQGFGYISIGYRNGINRNAALGRSLGYRYASAFDRSAYYHGVNAPGVGTRFRSRIPRYSDFYAFGIRRYDGPAGTSFQRGRRAYSPFYLPGLPTNFRY